MDILFDREVPVFTSNGEKSTFLMIRIAQEISKKVVEIQVTDDKDPFILYSLKIGENDYHELKKNQELKFDFNEFPKRLTTLLGRCAGYDGNSEALEKREYICEMKNSNKLEIVQSTEWKPLTWVSLEMKPATESMLKNYLAEKLKYYKASSLRLEQEVHDVRSTLTRRVQELEARLEEVHQLLKSEEVHQSQVRAELQIEHSNVLNEAKEMHQRMQRELQVQFEKQIKECERHYEQQIQELKKENENLKSQSSALAAERLKLIAQLENATFKLQETDAEFKKYKSEGITEFKIRSTGFQQQLEDKEKIIERMSELLETTRKQKEIIEESLQVQKSTNAHHEEAVKTLTLELRKGNHIIRTLESKYGNLKQKVMLQETIQQQQQATIKEKQEQVDKLNLEITSLQQEVKQKSQEAEHLQETIQLQKNKMEEFKEQLKRNEQAIEYLNNDLNKVHLLSNGGFGMGNGYSSLSIKDTQYQKRDVSVPVRDVSVPVRSAYQFRPSYKTLHPEHSVAVQSPSMLSTLPYPSSTAQGTPVSTTQANITENGNNSVQYNSKSKNGK